VSSHDKASQPILFPVAGEPMVPSPEDRHDPGACGALPLRGDFILRANVVIQHLFRMRSVWKGPLYRSLARQEIPLVQGMEKTAVPVPGPRFPFTLLFIYHAVVRPLFVVLMKPVRLIVYSKNSASRPDDKIAFPEHCGLRHAAAGGFLATFFICHPSLFVSFTDAMSAIRPGRGMG